MKIRVVLIICIILSCSTREKKIGYIDFSKFLRTVYSDIDFDSRYKQLELFEKNLDSLKSLIDSLKKNGKTDTITISDSLKSLRTRLLEFAKKEITGSAQIKQLNKRYGGSQDELWDKLYEEIYHDLNLTAIIELKSLIQIHPYDPNSMITVEDSAGYLHHIGDRQYDTTGTTGIDITDEMISRYKITLKSE